MFWQRIRLFALCLLALALGSCNTGEGISEPSLATLIRIANLVPDSGAIDVSANGNVVVNGLGQEALTQYQNVETGTTEIRVSITGTNTTILDQSYPLLTGTNFSYILSGASSNPVATLVVDPILNITQNTFQFRVIDVSVGAGALDIYLTAPGADLNASSPVISGVTDGAITGFITPIPGTYQLRITSFGTKQVIYDTGPQNFANLTATQAVVYSRGSGSLVNVTYLNIDTAGTGAIDNSLLANYKVVNAATTTPLNIFLDGELTLSNIPYLGSSSYQGTTATLHTFAVEATETPGSTLLTITPTLGTATDSSIVLAGTAGSLTGTVFTDLNLPPTAGKASIRFINVSPGGQSYDVFVNFSKVLTGLAQNVPSSYIEFDGGTTDVPDLYEIDFNVSGTTQPSLKLSNVPLVAGTVYTVYVSGPANALQGIVTQDKAF